MGLHSDIESLGFRYQFMVMEPRACDSCAFIAEERFIYPDGNKLVLSAICNPYYDDKGLLYTALVSPEILPVKRLSFTGLYRVTHTNPEGDSGISKPLLYENAIELVERTAKMIYLKNFRACHP